GTSLNNPIAGGWRSGPMRATVSPGTYTAKIKVDAQELETSIVVKPDPRSKLTPQDYQVKAQALSGLSDLLSKTHEMINNSEFALEQLKALKEKLESDPSGADQSVIKDIEGAIKKLSEFTDDVLRRPPPNMNYRQRPRLKEEIASLFRAIDGATAKPSTPQTNRVTQLGQETDEASLAMERIMSDDISKINDKVKDLPQIVIKKNMKKDM
ncbi:MAG: hypothetical protein RLN85_11955, partial [Pseudomonadales bacterium]